MISNTLQRSIVTYGTDEADAQLLREREPSPVAVEPNLAWDLQFGVWIYTQIITPRRFMRVCAACGRFAARKYIKVRSFLAAVFGPRLTEEEYAERSMICAECEHLTYREGRIRDRLRLTGSYCGACGCWKWWPAKLVNRLRMARAYCRERKHPGKYPRWVLYPLYGKTCRGCGSRQTRQE